jgi:hypothetical protein
LHKSVRGSDPDAALYWLVRMLDGGADPRYMARRLMRMASEDIGLADPRALRLALDAADVYERLGSPEGELALAECVVYLAVAPKSNAVYKAFNEARAFVKKDGTRPVPMHLRNAPTQLMKSAGLWQGLPLRARRSGGFAAGRNATCPMAWPRRLLPAGGAGSGDPHCRENAATEETECVVQNRSGWRPVSGRQLKGERTTISAANARQISLMRAIAYG